MSTDFNESFNDKGEKPKFIYKRNPLIEHAFQIFMFKTDKHDYEPVGEYTLLDMSEDRDLTEKKVINIISILNGRKNLIDLGKLTNCKVLFTILPKKAEEDPTKIMYRNHDGNGISEENALLVLEKGVLDDSAISGSGNA
jgi:hypothetical protein